VQDHPQAGDAGGSRGTGARVIRAAIACLLLVASTAHAIEKWADGSLPTTNGVWLWLDATKQIAAWEAHEKGLASGDALDVFYDSSGNGRDLVQAVRDAQPKFVAASNQAAVRFDGKADHLQ